MTRTKTPIAVLCLIFLIAACAENPTRKAALLVADNMDVYEKQVAAKVKAENAYYKQTAKDLRDSAEHTAKQEERGAQLTFITELADDAVHDAKALKLSRFQRFLREAHERDQTAAERMAARIATLEEANKIVFARLTYNASNIRQAREEILKLARTQSASERRKYLFSVVQEAAAKAIELQKAEAAAAAKNAPKP